MIELTHTLFLSSVSFFQKFLLSSVSFFQKFLFSSISFFQKFLYKGSSSLLILRLLCSFV